MIKVQSLRNRIILQFLIILAPLAAVLVILTLFDLQRATALENSLRLRELSLEAKDAYARFIEGVIDAMDTGTLSKARADALDVVAKALNEQRRIDPKHSLDDTVQLLGQISQSVRQDPSLPSILRLQPVSTQVSRALDANRLYYQQRHEHSIAQAIEGANRQNWIVLSATLLSVVFAVVFVRGMILGLTRPLARATDRRQSNCGRRDRRTGRGANRAGHRRLAAFPGADECQPARIPTPGGASGACAWKARSPSARRNWPIRCRDCRRWPR